VRIEVVLVICARVKLKKMKKQADDRSLLCSQRVAVVTTSRLLRPSEPFVGHPPRAGLPGSVPNSASRRADVV